METKTIVTLSKPGEETFIARSQAKRITLDLDKFTHVTLDFTDIRLVGQGFVDQIFRVFANAHPDITIDYVNANDDVTFMIERGIATANRKKDF